IGPYWGSCCFSRIFPKLPILSSHFPGLKTRTQRVDIAGGDSLLIRSLKDHQQYYDPHGAARRLGVCSASWPLFGLVWPSSIHLAERLQQRPVKPEDLMRALGCGLALPALDGRRRRARTPASDRRAKQRERQEAKAGLSRGRRTEIGAGPRGYDGAARNDAAGASPWPGRDEPIL